MIEVVRISDDGLRREIWRFDLSASRFGVRDTVNAHVGYYGVEDRATTRHKFKANPARRYDSFDKRSYNSGIKDVDVPLPSDVVDEVTRRITVAVHRPEVDRRDFW